MQRRHLLRLGLAAGATLALTGCGFRLRGYDQPLVSLDALALAGPETDLRRLVTRRLESAGTRVHDDAARGGVYCAPQPRTRARTRAATVARTPRARMSFIRVLREL